MPWHARLDLTYSARPTDASTAPDARRQTVLHFEHDGPLRVLKSLYPEGPGVCHNVLVHPPGGLVGGDVLDIQVQVGTGAHALVTTPGATRFYKSNGEVATQRTHLKLAEGARLEWLPLEAIAYNACDARNELTMDLAPGAQLLAWDITALGLPLANLPFVQGRLVQHLAWPGVFLEHGDIDATDALLMDGGLGLAGQRCLASLIYASGDPMPRAQRERLQERTQALLGASPAGALCGVTAPNPHMLVLRGLAPVVEPLMNLWRQVWACWRQDTLGATGQLPRIWAM